MWIFYSLLGAFFQATEMAVEKKALQTKGANNFIAFAAFFSAGIFLGLFLFLRGGEAATLAHLSGKFWIGIFSAVFLNSVAIYFLYKALDLSEISYLLPYMTLTSLTIIVPPIFLFQEYPSLTGFIGIAIITSGALIMGYKWNQSDDERERHRNNRKGLAYFLITAACYTVSPAVIKLAVVESSPVLAAFLIHFLVGAVFGIIVLVLGETEKIKNIFQAFRNSEKKIFVGAILLAGIFMAFSNMSINYAFALENVAYVMAIKRVMPFFAFFIGYFYFRERANTGQKLIATALMVAGAIIITVFK